MTGSVNPAQVGGAPVGRHHPATSAAAAARVRVGSQESALLLLVDSAGAAGLTCYEAAADPLWERIRPNITENQIGARMLSLREKGLVVRLTGPDGSYVRRPTKTAEAIVHVITAAGVDELNRIS